MKVTLKKIKILISSKQEAVLKRPEFYFQEIQTEIINQYTYFGFTFIPSQRKQVRVETLISKERKSWCLIQKMLNEPKAKKIDTYRRLTDSIIKSILYYACECWRDSLTIKDLSYNKIEQFHLSVCKEISTLIKNVNNMKVLAEASRVSLKMNIEIQMFKYL